MPKQVMFYRGRLTNPRRQGLPKLEIPDEERAKMIAEARENVRRKIAARKGPSGRRSTRTRE